MNVRKILLPGDARGARGIFSRGKPVYNGGTNAPRAGHNIKKPTISLQEAARRRVLRNGNN
jgi:hypothetical protein